MLREIIFFTYGDAALPSTWSNVPYLFTETLMQKGIKVHRVNLCETPLFSTLNTWGGRMNTLLNTLYPGNQYAYNRSWLFKVLTNRAVKAAVRRYSHADLCIFANFEFYNKYNDIPTLLFSDWTYKILILDHLGRKPYPFEKRFSAWQKTAIERADYVVSLFPRCARMMKEDYPKANIHALGNNVINSMYAGKHDVEAFIEKKQKGRRLLFIGGGHYREGALLLAEAVKMLHEQGKDAELDIIGMTPQDLGNQPDYVHCHGYLHKDIEEERALYYDLLTGARAICNPSRVWAGYSSTIEAMYFATPVVVTPYKDFVDEFGEDIPFGAYVPAFDPHALADILSSVMDSPDYAAMCRNAYERVKDYTWSNYVDKLIELVG